MDKAYTPPSYQHLTLHLKWNCLKVYVVYWEEMLVLSPELVEGIQLLHSVFNFTDPSEPPAFEVQEAREFQKRGLVRLGELVKFTQDSTHYPPPSDHLELLGMVRMADFLCVDSFMNTAVMWLRVCLRSPIATMSKVFCS